MQVISVEQMQRFQPEKMQKVNMFESEHMFCDLYCLEPGQEQKLHAHDGNDKIYYVISGSGAFTVGNEVKAMTAGQITCAFSGEPHGVKNTGDQRLTCLVFMAPHPNPR